MHQHQIELFSCQHNYAEYLIQCRSFSRFVSSMYQFGAGFLFITAAFDDKASCFAVRLSVPSNSNCSFPAKDGGLMDQMFNCKDTFEAAGTPFKMKINDTALLKLIAESPVASVQFFKFFFEVCDLLRFCNSKSKNMVT